MRMYARKTVDANFTTKEIELLIDASLNGHETQEASQLLRDKFGGNGYMSGTEIEDVAYEIDPEKYGYGGFGDIDW